MFWFPILEDGNSRVEINLNELQKFIFQEALFLQKMENLLQQSTHLPHIFSGKSLFLLGEFYQEWIKHWIEMIHYFSPKEIK